MKIDYTPSLLLSLFHAIIAGAITGFVLHYILKYNQTMSVSFASIVVFAWNKFGDGMSSRMLVDKVESLERQIDYEKKCVHRDYAYKKLKHVRNSLSQNPVNKKSIWHALDDLQHILNALSKCCEDETDDQEEAIGLRGDIANIKTQVYLKTTGAQLTDTYIELTRKLDDVRTYLDNI